MTIRRSLALPAALLVTAAFAAPADATIIPGKSIAGVAIGAKESSVTKMLGKPDSRKSLNGQALLHWSKLRLSVVTISKKVSEVTTKSRTERTPTGLGRGTKLKSLR